MTRLLAIALFLFLASCGMPAAVVWGTVGAGFGWLASANNLAGEIIQKEEQKP